MKFHLGLLFKKNTYSISGAPPPHVDLNAGIVIKNKNKLASLSILLWTQLLDFQINIPCNCTRHTFT